MLKKFGMLALAAGLTFAIAPDAFAQKKKAETTGQAAKPADNCPDKVREKAGCRNTACFQAALARCRSGQPI